MSVCPPVRPSVRPPVRLFVHPFVRLSVHASVSPAVTRFFGGLKQRRRMTYFMYTNFFHQYLELILSYERYVVNNSSAGEFSSDKDKKVVNNLEKLFAISLQFSKMTKFLFCLITFKRSELESRRSVQMKDRFNMFSNLTYFF